VLDPVQHVMLFGAFPQRLRQSHARYFTARYRSADRRAHCRGRRPR
jgi:hypothetical protein